MHPIHLHSHPDTQKVRHFEHCGNRRVPSHSNPLVDAKLVVHAYVPLTELLALIQLRYPLSVPELAITLMTLVVQEPPGSAFC